MIVNRLKEMPVLYALLFRRPDALLSRLKTKRRMFLYGNVLSRRTRHGGDTKKLQRPSSPLPENRLSFKKIKKYHAVYKP